MVSQRLLTILAKKFGTMSLEGLIVTADFIKTVNGIIDKTDTSYVRPLTGLTKAIAARIEELQPTVRT